MVASARFIYNAKIKPMRARAVCDGYLLSLNPVTFGYMHCSLSTVATRLISVVVPWMLSN